MDKNKQKHTVSELHKCNTLTDKSNGIMGFGLDIVNYCALLSGAEVKVKSRKGCYTMFKVCL